MCAACDVDEQGDLPASWNRFVPEQVATSIQRRPPSYGESLSTSTYHSSEAKKALWEQGRKEPVR
jgi:hypothetical protein